MNQLLNLEGTPGCHNVRRTMSIQRRADHRGHCGGKNPAMKIIRHSIVALTLLFLMPVAQASGPLYALQVDGLACPFCAYGIEKKLNSIEGIDDIQVDIRKGEVIVIMAEGFPLAEELAREKVKDAGFTLRAFSQRSGEDPHDPE